jgi:hypothetical protein
METNINEIEINGVKYVKKGSEEKLAVNTDGLPYVIIRADRAGVFAGYLAEDNDSVVILHEARRLWYWSGAASLSQLAAEGVKNPKDCKFPAAIAKIKVLGVIENIPATEAARKIIEGVPAWKM